MMIQYLLAGAAFFGMFIMFLVISKTLNNILNHIVKLQYLLQKEVDFRKEQQAIKKLMEEDAAEKPKIADDPEESDTPPK